MGEEQQPKKLKAGQWALKTALASGFLGLLLWYAGQHSITVQQTTEAMASVPLAFVVLVELFDKLADKNDYYNKLYAGIYGSIGKKKSRVGAILISLLFAALGMLGVMWAITGTMTLNIGDVGPANLFVSGSIGLYIFAPETGNNELILWFWTAATIATKGAFISILPHIPGLI